MKILNLPEEYKRAYEILGTRLGVENIDATVRFVEADEMTVGFKNGEGYIKCKQKHHFSRLLGLFCQSYKGEEFEICEKAHFETLSCMWDISAGSAPTVKATFEFCEYLALMGYNQIQLYMEDMYCVPERPFFGYLRGRYSYDELKEIDDYCFDLGIEAVPCIQTLGHMQHYLKWPEGGDVAENGMVLLPESEKTYTFIEQMLRNASAPFRSRQIHVGMDETHGLGLGNYLKTHGYTDPLKIFIDHLNKVTEICLYLGLKPMMWYDMLFCFSAKNYGKYEKDTVVPKELSDKIHPEMKLVYWHYGEVLNQDCDDYMIKKHLDMGRLPMYGGGVWIWAGALPDNIYTELGTREALPACKKNGVKEVMLTVWAYNTTIYHNALLELCRYGEYTYNDDDRNIKERFEFITKADHDAFLKMSNYHAMYDSGKDYDAIPYDYRFEGEKINSQDMLLGVLDETLINEPRSGFYAKMADYYRTVVEENENGEWDYLYRYTLALFEGMAAKSEIGETLTVAYKNGDRAQLERIADLMHTVYEKVEEVRSCHVYHMEKYLRPFGREKMLKAYGGKKERALYCEKRVRDYLAGRVDRLEELEEERLHREPAAWGGIVAPF